MKFSLYIIAFFFLIGNISAQNFSNKGKEFWLVFPPHQRSENGNEARLSVYISSDKASSGNIFVNGFKIAEFSIEPNVTREYVLDRDRTYILEGERANSGNQNNTANGRGIQVVVDEGKPPVVVYAHMYAAARSAASIILPSSVLQRKYMVMAFTQLPTDRFDGESSRSQFSVIAVEDNTKIKIKFRRNGLLDPIEVDVDLFRKGDVYQYQDQLDLTGTEIESISDGTNACKKIAVFSGSSANIVKWPFRSGIPTSKDPMFQQCYPENTWGKNYIITSFKNKQNIQYRVMAKEDGTIFSVNGFDYPLRRGQFYDLNSFTFPPPFEIKSNKAIAVAQVSSSQAHDSGPGDPELLILNSVEQSIENVTVFLSSNENIFENEQYVNIIIKDQGIPDFKINNISYQSEFIKIPGTDYSYLMKSFIVTRSTYFSLNMTAKIGFNAFCYGFGNFESYSYSAGTNVRDLFQSVNISNTEAVVPYTRTCVNTPFRFSVTLPYKPVSLKWDFTNSGQLVDDQGNLVPSFTKSLGGAELPADSSYQSENDPNVTLYVYKIDKNFLVKQKVDVPYKITTVSSSADGCSGEQVIENIIEVKDPPKTILAIESGGCINSDNIFKASNILDEGIIENFYRWYIDGQLVKNDSSIIKRSFSTEGVRQISVELITDIGCVSVKDSKPITLSQKPNLIFTEDPIRCIGKEFTVTNNSTLSGNGQIVEGIWKVNDVYLPTETQFSNLKYKTDNSTISLKYLAKTNTGCTDSTTERTVIINPNPVLDVILPEFCLTDGIAKFKANSTIDAPDIVSQINWNFGDEQDPLNNVDQGANVEHLFRAVGSYNMNIRAISSNNCITSKDTIFFVNGSNPNANFKFLNNTFCSNKEIVLQNNSNVSPGNITKVELSWNLDDGTVISQFDERPDTNNIYKRLFQDFTQEKKILRAKLVAYSGATCKGEYEIVSTAIYGSAKVKIGLLPDQCTSYPSIVLPDPIVTPVQNTTGIGNYFGALVATADIPGKFKFTPPKIGASSFVFYKYETQNGCITIDTSSIKLFPTPIVNAGPDIQLLQDSVIKINASASNGINMRYRWSPTTYLDNPNILQPNIEQPRSDVAYVLTAFGTGPSNFNCISKDTVFLTSLNYLNPPNTLVPGRPPYDKWVIDNIQKYKGCMLKIFDINGSIIKSYDNGYDNNKPWDGTNQKNQFVPAGTYYYILDPKNGRKIQTGYVTIHR